MEYLELLAQRDASLEEVNRLAREHDELHRTIISADQEGELYSLHLAWLMAYHRFERQTERIHELSVRLRLLYLGLGWN